MSFIQTPRSTSASILITCWLAMAGAVGTPIWAQTQSETESRLQHKLKTVESQIPQWAASGRDPKPIGERVKLFESLMRTGRVAEAEKELDRVLSTLKDIPAKTESKVAGNAAAIAYTDDVQYLVFMLPQGTPVFEATDPYSVIDARVQELVDRIGTTGRRDKRKLGFGIVIPPWILDKAMPGKISAVIKDAFRVARERDVAVQLSIESHYMWESRPDLWNFYDPHSPGFDPDNKNNVEWTDWQGTAYRHRFLDWGAPQELPPPICVNAPKIKSEVSRLVRTVVAPAIKKGVDDLTKAGAEQLFAGATVTSEPMIENYSIVDQVNPGLAKFMAERRAPKLRLGFNALTQAGYSQKNPPTSIEVALAKVNQDFGAYWASEFVKAGISSRRLYTHVAANGGVPGTLTCSFTNAPISAAFNQYCRPGWTTYAAGPLQNGFKPIYDELTKRKNPHWGSTEASPSALGGPAIPTYEYLRWHFGHGATLIVMNTGATSDSLAKALETGVWGPQSIAAYRRFLAGR